MRTVFRIMATSAIAGAFACSAVTSVEQPEDEPASAIQAVEDLESHVASAVGFTPFKMAPPSIEPIPLERLDPKIRAQRERIEEWAETQNGYGVHQAWTRYSAMRATASDSLEERTK